LESQTLTREEGGTKMNKQKRERVVFNYGKLLGKIKENGLTQKSVAFALKADEGTISSKFKNRVSFTQSEIDGICELLDIPNEEIGAYFFAR
jgi:hypothetical protein